MIELNDSSLDGDLIIDLNLYLKQIVPEVNALVFGINLRRRNGVLWIEVFVDHERGGISLDKCAKVHKKFIHLIEENQRIKGNYEVDVASPGMDCDLKKSYDFRRVIGYEVRFFLTKAFAGKIEHAGKIKEVTEESVLIETKFGDLNIPIKVIHKAKQIID